MIKKPGNMRFLLHISGFFGVIFREVHNHGVNWVIFIITSDTLRMVRTNIVRNGARLILKKSKMTLGGAVLLRKMRKEIPSLFT